MPRSGVQLCDATLNRSARDLRSTSANEHFHEPIDSIAGLHYWQFMIQEVRISSNHALPFSLFDHGHITLSYRLTTHYGIRWQTTNHQHSSRSPPPSPPDTMPSLHLHPPAYPAKTATSTPSAPPFSSTPLAKACLSTSISATRRLPCACLSALHDMFEVCIGLLTKR